jgi:putative transposase
MFVSGVSQSRVGAVMEKLIGSALSQSTGSRMSLRREANVADWLARPLAAEYKIAYLDGVYFPIRHGEKVDQTAVLGALGVGMDGHKEVLAMMCGAEESKDCWLSLLRDLRKRGVEKLELAGADCWRPCR